MMAQMGEQAKLSKGWVTGAKFDPNLPHRPKCADLGNVTHDTSAEKDFPPQPPMLPPTSTAELTTHPARYNVHSAASAQI